MVSRGSSRTSPRYCRIDCQREGACSKTTGWTGDAKAPECPGDPRHVWSDQWAREAAEARALSHAAPESYPHGFFRLNEARSLSGLIVIYNNILNHEAWWPPTTLSPLDELCSSNKQTNGIRSLPRTGCCHLSATLIN